MHPRRTLLLLLLVALPVAAVVGGAIVADTIEPTPDERARHVVGQADLRIELSGAAERPRLQALLPERARSEQIFLGKEIVRAPGARFDARLIALPGAVEEPLATGMFSLLRGRLPRNSGEVALAPALLTGLRKSIGDSVTLEYGPWRRITGVVVDPEDLNLPLVVRTSAPVELGGRTILLVQVPQDAMPLATALREAGHEVSVRSEEAVTDPFLARAIFALGGLGLLEAALVIASSFAVTLRRRQREIGLLGSVGTEGRRIVGAVVASSTALGLVGGATGVVLGVLAAIVLRVRLDVWNGRLNGPLEIGPDRLVAAIALGCVTTAMAAFGPARAAARVPILHALRSRRPTESRPGRSLAWGSVLVGVGVTLLAAGPRDPAAAGAISVIGGSILGILGFGWISPGCSTRSPTEPEHCRSPGVSPSATRVASGPETGRSSRPCSRECR
ncbi:MAG: FtsX-like permease family protein [Candidatus Eisenbacteria bacterium]